MAKTTIDYDRWLTDENIELIKAWARSGIAYAEIAKWMGMSLGSLDKFKEREPRIKEALNEKAVYADYRVQNSLYNRAIGYTIKLTEDKITKDGDVVSLEKEVHIPADVQAAIFWLTNRMSDKWQSRKSVEQKTEIINDGFNEAISKAAKSLYSNGGSNELKKIVEE